MSTGDSLTDQSPFFSSTGNQILRRIFFSLYHCQKAQGSSSDKRIPGKEHLISLSSPLMVLYVDILVAIITLKPLLKATNNLNGL
jgi:hypothetical protein